ncbi:DUF4333 domain-containing protein [Kribbella soli]|uniref:DUF4333 domain-containing protein n=1 Tax=Kribbella soli TaxID=1124743 RepID=A0A4R0HR75_9ACTN|nr:DUF4333 domain-containing protein [Kribbella soli]TCC10299.1 DUF4333 domain-containing protein [Kribbella soli]
MPAITSSQRSSRSAAALLAAVLAGCSAEVTVGGGTVDSDRTAAAVTTYLREHVPDIQVGAVSCPKDVKVAEGKTFQCTADVAGTQLPVTVTLSHVTDGDYTYELKPAKALIDTGKVVTEIRSRLPAQAAGASIDCGTPLIRVVEVGGKIPCTVSLAGKRQAVQTVVDDLGGTVHFEPATVWVVTPPSIGKIGDKLTVYGESGAAQLEVTVTRLKFTTGDDFDQPEHGLYMGAYVTLRALIDQQDLIEITAVANGTTYSGDAIVTSTTFDPPLAAAILNQGEQTAGWLIFDVPTRHGQLVIHDTDNHQLGAWKY